MQTQLSTDTAGTSVDISGGFRPVNHEGTDPLQVAVFNNACFSSMTTDEKGLIQAFNVGAERMFGYSAAEVLNRLTPFDFSELAYATVRARDLSREMGVTVGPGFKALVFKASLGVEDLFEWICVRKDGSQLPVLVSITALRDATGGVIGYILVGTDNSARKHLEAAQDSATLQLQVIPQVSTASTGITAAEAHFLSQMGQHLRAPLESVSRLADMLAAESTPATPIERAGIESMLRAGRSLLNLVGEIIDLGTLESGSLVLRDQPTSPAQLMRDCESEVAHLAQRHEVRLTVPVFDGALLVRADYERLKQVVTHLLSNAIRYNRPNGTVVVEYTTPVPGRFRISVRDTGSGIPLVQVAQLFEPFSRFGERGSDREGAGLGLVLCKRLMELMGGSISVESSVGVGSLFWIELNAAGAPAEAVPRAESVAVPRAQRGAAVTRTLLYVEDDPANMLLIERLIARRPEIRLLTAVDGTVAIDVARNDEPDVILMDINLPGISGIQTLEMLQRDPLTAKIPVVALSANATPNDIRRGIDVGFFRYLTKPLRLDLFNATLDEAFEAAFARRDQGLLDA